MPIGKLNRAIKKAKKLISHFQIHFTQNNYISLLTYITKC